MKYNTSSIEPIFDSEEEFIPFDESPLYFGNPQFYESQQVQIEQKHYESTEFRGPQNRLQTSENFTKNFPIKDDLMANNIENILILRRNFSIYALVGEKDEDPSDSLFNDSNSRNEPELSTGDQTFLMHKKSKQKRIKKGYIKPQKRKRQEGRSQIPQKQIRRPRRNTSSPNRKGKHSQSKTQKFIFFMTQFHYSKNFCQYFKKKIIQNKEKLENYINSTPVQKIKVIDDIIFQLSEYNMTVHYKVLESNFFKKFNPQQQDLIKKLFWKVIQKTYMIRLELEKKNIEEDQDGERNEKQRFFDEKGEAEFNKIFDTILSKQPFAEVLTACNFEQSLEEAMTKMSRKQSF